MPTTQPTVLDRSVAQLPVFIRGLLRAHIAAGELDKVVSVPVREVFAG